MVSACQTQPKLLVTSGETKKEIASLVTDDVYRKSYVPVSRSHADVLTEKTWTTIQNNNRVYWCTYPDTQPLGFDRALCKPKP